MMLNTDTTVDASVLVGLFLISAVHFVPYLTGLSSMLGSNFDRHNLL